ncbi:UBX domain-containing protein 11 isoform X2 [Genypterus blacodes]|uniref:UBX domain-containing protein 11 isoform X2 n=1 Tax=Genypterus blacodes TaxID=154954 RepID=UPI003F75CB0E
MSSPLSMLKKTKRVPLQGPGRRDRDKVQLRREVESETLKSDDPPPTGDLSSPNSKPSPNKGTPPSDLELLSDMMQRLTLLERKVKSQAQEIERRDIKIAVLEEKLKLLKKTENAPGLSDGDDLFIRCYKLQTQVYEMECFLSDYGLIWVGDGVSCDTGCKPEECVQAQKSRRDRRNRGLFYTTARNFNMNFDLVLHNIKELNIMAGDGESFVQATPTGAHLAKKDPIPLRLFSNGIVLFDGPFRSYKEPSTQQCMQDLMDGYFPSELQQRFPDGVPFKVHDERNEEYIARPPWERFPGQGRAIHGLSSKELPGRRLTMDQFLKRLPKVVIKAGRVIDIREPVKEILQESSTHTSTPVTLIDTPALQALQERQQLSDSDPPPTAARVATLKVKSEDGNHTYIAKMFYSDTIGHLREYLDKHRNAVKLRGGKSSAYGIFTMHPRRSYEDQQTLLSCGLTTNATLVLRKLNIHSLIDPYK